MRSSFCRAGWLGALLVCAGLVEAAAQSGAETVPRIEAPPALDGNLDEPCWKQSALLSNFTQPKSAEAPGKAIEARLCHDGRHLYVGVRCAEPEPQKMRAEQKLRGEQVWTDDCLELWVRTTGNALDCDQFIVNGIGTQEEHRKRGGKGEKFEPGWDVKVHVGGDQFTAEFKIPAADVGLDAFRDGDLLELKIGREDRTAEPVKLSVWPPRASYAGFEGFGRVYVSTPNTVPDPALATREGWSFSKGDEGLFTSVEDAGVPAVKIAAPGRYTTLQRTLKLRSNRLYRLTAEGRGEGSFYVRVRVDDPAQKGKPIDLRFSKSEAYQARQATFTTGASGEALLIVGVTEESGQSVCFLRQLEVVREVGLAASGPALSVSPGDEPLRVTKLLPADCRSVRGFIVNPIDGSLHSGRWDGGNWEYNQPSAGSGVGYAWNRNDGLHLKLADREGFNAVVVRGGIKAKLFRDVPGYDTPEGGTLLHEFPGQTENSRAWFDAPVQAGKVSFFEVGDGKIADLSFFRVTKGAGTLPAPHTGAVNGKTEQAAAELRPAHEKRFGTEDRAVYACSAPGAPEGGSLNAPPGHWIHLITEPLEAETPLAALGLDAKVRGEMRPLAFTLRVQDPLNPRLELHGADYALAESGRLRLILDFPDQIVPAGRRLWVSLRFDAPAKLTGVKLERYVVERAVAQAEALEHRKTLLKGFYANMSEARPWNSFHSREQMDKWHADPKNAAMSPWVKEIFDTIDHCRAIDAEGKDPIVRQYYEWCWRNILRKENATSAFETRFDSIAGVPEWAVLARQAWLQSREVAAWWIDERMTPNGEFGGEVGDDTDLMQNFAGFPMFERDGVGGRVLDAGARLAEQAERANLEEGLNRQTTDPLHAYEEGINHEALMLWWNYGDPVYFNRCLAAARSTEKLTLVNAAGHRHFKSQECGSADLRMDRKPDTDGHAHPLMWHPALEVCWYNRHPTVLKWLDEWAVSWLAHQQPGAYATGVEVASDRVTASETYPFAGGYGGQASAHTFLAQITGDKKYVAPFNEFLNAQGRSQGDVRRMLPELLQDGLLDLTPETEAKLVEENRASTYLFYRTGDKKHLIETLKSDVTELQRYKHIYTTSECFTDRVFLYALTMPSILYCGGHATRNKFNHSYAVSWDGFGTDYAALVLKASPNELKVLLCNVSDRPLKGRGTVWRLAHARYSLSFGPDANEDDAADEVNRKETVVLGKGHSFEVALPKKGVYVLHLQAEQGQSLGALETRADLALSPLALKIDGAKLRGQVFNMGVADAPEAVVALVDAQGAVQQKQAMGKLAGVGDLQPKAFDFEFTLPAEHAGWRVVADPDGKLEEIYEGNNRIAVP